MTTTLPSTLVRPIWAKVIVDPITIPLAGKLSNTSAITPNKVTALAGLLALGASAAFLGELRIGGVLLCLAGAAGAANIVNVRTIWRIAAAMDSETARVR
jgi:hypothetical protein